MTRAQPRPRHTTNSDTKRTLRSVQQLQRSTFGNQNTDGNVLINTPRNTPQSLRHALNSRSATRRPFRTTHRNTFATRHASHGSALGAHTRTLPQLEMCRHTRQTKQRNDVHCEYIEKHTKVNLIIEASRLTFKKTGTRRELITTSTEWVFFLLQLAPSIAANFA